ncbi:TPA: hypothetical protein DEW47_00715 [Patescibacteria group bacterium]|nr:MAG: hypothetical protein UT71_C0017G0007 [Parcubacteria group bacterium GW2011_GWF2_40_10]KKR47499.1 MAG: hypothetical protein UT83_C0008G0007 [Parcubacteria group bacterium GW2011_GWA2_40_143]KKR59918.1 MAG: hypothetical protein UT97_C0008G0008 [Parcubacteria group bacterium GW2011_GWC2_40_31]KKR75760.1 MAG: hypothetical protein UU20_C0044G0002 [Parcubacteria group bacterium GW2011_GWE2_40_8]KKR81988.1 MAG: hypothetical protein UU28_C0016G0021 [Parcubacteria group bacterium GW2011_GWD2_40_
MLFGTKNKKHKVENIRLKDLLFLSLRNFKVKTGRTLLTVLGIGVSFATIFFLISLGYGLQNILLKQISSKEALLTIDISSPNKDIFPINDQVISKIAANEKVERIDSVISVPGQLDFQDGDAAFEVLFTGVTESFFKSNVNLMQKGNYPKQGEAGLIISSGMGRILESVGSSFANKKTKIIFYVPEIIDGTESIKIMQKEGDFKIIDVMDNGDQSVVYLPISFMSDTGLPYSSARVVIRSDKDMEEVKDLLIDMGFNVSTIADTVDQANKIFNIFKIILAFFGIAALVVAVVGMINTMTIALLERTNEIGVMKIFGITERDVQRLFMLESAIIGFLGGVSGLVMGFLLSQFFNLSIAFLANALGGKSVNLFYYPAWFIIAIIFFASVVGLGTGFFPSRKAARMDPLNALRYK